MGFFRYRGRFLKGVALFLRVLISYKLFGLINMFSSTGRKKDRLKRLHARNAFMIRERMVDMRGVLIKIGQFLSSRVDILPEEYTTELSKLQDQVPPAPFSDIAQRVTAELGPMDEVFSSFDEMPVASASLGQVHKACLRHGDCVVVKVQYPGIEDVIAADIRTLNFVIRILKILYRRINLDVIYSEFSRIVREELDYIHEGKTAEAFARNFAKNDKIRIPVVYWPFTTTKVLTLEYLEGTKITDFDEIGRQGISKKEVARLLAEAYCQMFFSDGLFHGDPHPGNIFVRPGPEVILVDFGMTDRISGPMKEGLRRAFGAVVDRNSGAMVRALVDMGFIPLTKDMRPIVQLVERLFNKYRDITPDELRNLDIEEIGRDINEALQITPSMQIPNDLILFGRVVGMLNGLGSRLDPETNIIEIAAPFAKRFIMSGDAAGAGILTRLASSARSLIRLPGLLREFLANTNRGETCVEITSDDIVQELRKISRIGKGFIIAVLCVGLGGIAVFLRINGFEMEGVAAGAGAGLLLLWLMGMLLRL